MGTFPAPWGVQTSTEHSEVGVEYPAPAKQEANALVAFECLHRGNLLGNRELEEINTIEFISVSFTYPGSKEKAIDDFTLRINKFDRVALIGLNGSGKTTCIKLLLRFYDPQSGKILINGKDIREYNIINLRKKFGVMFQEYNIYEFSLKDNTGSQG